MEVISEGFDHKNVVHEVKLPLLLESFIASKIIAGDWKHQMINLQNNKREALQQLLSPPDSAFLESVYTLLDLSQDRPASSPSSPSSSTPISPSTRSHQLLLDSTPSLSYWQFSAIFSLFQRHYPTEASQKTLFGNWKSPRVALWHTLLDSWTLANLHWAEAIHLIQTSVTAILPRCRDRIDDLNLRISSLEKRISEQQHIVSTRRQAFQQSCHNLTVSSPTFESDFQQFVLAAFPEAVDSFRTMITQQDFLDLLDYFERFTQLQAPEANSMRSTLTAIDEMRAVLSSPIVNLSSSNSTIVQENTIENNIIESFEEFQFELLDSGCSASPLHDAPSKDDTLTRFAQLRSAVVMELELLSQFFNQRLLDLSNSVSFSFATLFHTTVNDLGDRETIARYVRALSQMITFLQSDRVSHCVDITLSDRYLARLVAVLRNQEMLLREKEQSIETSERSRAVAQSQLTEAFAILHREERSISRLISEFTADLSPKQFRSGKVIFSGPGLASLQKNIKK